MGFLPEIKLPKLDFLEWLNNPPKFHEGPPGPLPVISKADFDGLYKALSDIIKLLKNLPEVVKQLTEIVKIVTPFTCIIPLLKRSMDAYNDLQNVDVGEIVKAPNLDYDSAYELARLFAIPYIGDLVKNQINLAWLDRYQKSTGRGFPSSLDQLHFMVNGGITPATYITEVTSRVPDFFLDNDIDMSIFSKGYRKALKEHLTKHPSK